MCYSKYCDGGGDKGGCWELFFLLSLWIHGGAAGAESPGAPVPDPSRWVAIYRLLNMFLVAGRRDALSLPTSVHVERDGFPPSFAPSARPSGFASNFGFCNVGVSLSIDGDCTHCS